MQYIKFLLLLLFIAGCANGDLHRIEIFKNPGQIQAEARQFTANIYKNYNYYMPYGSDLRLFSQDHAGLVGQAEEFIESKRKKSVDINQRAQNQATRRTAQATSQKDAPVNVAREKSTKGDMLYALRREGYGPKDRSTLRALSEINLDQYALEPAIQPSIIKTLTTCPVPRLSLIKVTITTHVEWQIFVYCVLGMVPASLETAQYPEIVEMKHRISAFRFLSEIQKAFLEKHEHAGRSFEEQLGLFERLFLVTKFRTLTQREKEVASELIEKSGLEFVSRLYLVNWFLSDFYKDHMDFKKNPGGPLFSHVVEGKVVEESNNLLEGVFYRLADENVFGFRTEGYSSDPGFVRKLLGSNNFMIQFYLPGEVEKKEMPKHVRVQRKHNEDKSKKRLRNKNYTKDKESFEASRVHLFAGLRGYQVAFQEILLNEKPKEDVVVRMKGASQQTPGAAWPAVSMNPGLNPFKQLSFAIDPAGVSGNCQKPEILPEGVVHGDGWQKYVYCVLNFSSFTTRFGINYQPFTNKESAFHYLFRVAQDYLESDFVVHASDDETLTKIYQLITMAVPGVVEKNIFKQVLSRYSLEASVNYLLEHWFQSDEYLLYYNFSKSSFDSKEWYLISGKVIDFKGAPIGGAKVSLLYPTMKPVLSAAPSGLANAYSGSVISAQDGSFELPVLLSSSDVAGALVLEVLKGGFSPVTRRVRLEPNSIDMIMYQEYIYTIRMLSLGQALTDQESVVESPGGDVKIKIPFGAVDGPVIFEMSELSPTLVNGPGSEVIEFSVTPGYDFNEPVEIQVALTDELKALLHAAEKDHVALFYKSGPAIDDYQLLENISYDPANNLLKGETLHFSTFVIGKCGIIPCAPGNQVHPMASVLDRQVIQYPSQLPQLKAEYRNLLEVGGWSTADVDAFVLPAGCNDQTCPPIDYQLSNADFGFPVDVNRAEVTIGSIDVISGKLKGVLLADIQAEQCAVNPKASNPQLRLNHILSSETDMELLLKFNNVQIHYPCLEVQYSCFLGLCMPVPVKASCREPVFSHTAKITILKNQQAVYKRPSLFSGSEWGVGPMFSTGNIRVEIPDSIRTNQVKTIYADKLHDALLSRQFEDRDKINQKITDYLNAQSIRDPDFNQENCFEAGAPAVTILSLSEGDVVSNVGGAFSNGVAIPESTTIRWTSNRDGEYKVFVNKSCSHYSSGGELYSGVVHKNTENIISFDAGQLTKDGANSVSFCIKDKWNQEIGEHTHLFYKTYMATTCVQEPFTVTENVCTDVTREVCNNVKVGTQKYPGCWSTIFWHTFCTCGSKAVWPYNQLPCYRDVYKVSCSFVTATECNDYSYVVYKEVCDTQYSY